MKIFVYGTLKLGYHNNYLLEQAQRVTEDILHGYRLWYSAGPRSFPVAFPDPEYSIVGEVYDISKDINGILSRLDRLEGVPMLYIRENGLLTQKKHIVSLYVAGPMFEGNSLQPVPDIDNLSIWSRDNG